LTSKSGCAEFQSELKNFLSPTVFKDNEQNISVQQAMRYDMVIFKEASA
jgi:hypothetical protein